MTYDAIIIGGGPAGASAAIELSKRGHRVLLLEKRKLPASKLCGEFLSPEVRDAFRQLGVSEEVKAAGAHPIRRARITTAGGAAFEESLPGTALGLSRYRLDHLLFKHARTCGVDARDGQTVRGVAGSLEEGFHVETAGEAFRARLVFGAYGRRGLLDRKLERPFLDEQSPLVAFKAHYEGAQLSDVIEVHAFPGGYCGLSPVEEGRLNLCWIARESSLKAAGGDPEAMIDASLKRNPVLERRLRALHRVSDTFEAVGQVSLARKSLFSRGVCMVGDTAGMIAPFCGDGMAMALRSAALAAEPASDYLNGRSSAESFRAQYTEAWERAFRTRMQLGRWVHRASLRPMAASLAVHACRLAPGLGRWLMRKTRG